MDAEDPRETSFTIQVLGRMYHLRADTRATCKDWVITLNRVKEARLQQGNVKLLNRVVDFFHDSGEGATPRVVVVANRQRTRAVDEEEQLYQTPEDPADPVYVEQKRLSTLGTAVVARWSKRSSALQRLGTKLARWARSVKKYGCQDVDTENIALDRHVHPPGHDDRNRLPTAKSDTGRYASNYGRNKDSVPVVLSTIAANDVPPNTTSSAKPFQPARSLSTASDEYRTIS